MICQTVKEGSECTFMSKKGCGYTGGSCHIIVETCEGCNKVVELATGKYCKVYPEPSAKWILGICPTASHVKREVKEVVQKLNPLKASKRGK